MPVRILATSTTSDCRHYLSQRRRRHQPDPRSCALAPANIFSGASDRDSIYNKSSAIIRAGIGTTARYVGAETDLLANYNFPCHLQGYTGYSYFFPGTFIHKSGPHKASNFFYAALQYTF